MANSHPWRRVRRVFPCTPDCPERVPGCHDHCERYIRAKEKHDQEKAEARRIKHIDDYSITVMLDNRDISAKRAKHNKSYRML